MGTGEERTIRKVDQENKDRTAVLVQTSTGRMKEGMNRLEFRGGKSLWLLLRTQSTKCGDAIGSLRLSTDVSL